jgi:hypothetical protein
MYKWPFIIIVALWLNFAKPLGANTRPGIAPDGVTGAFTGYAASTQRKRICFVKNDEKKPSDNAAADGTEKTGEGTFKPKAPTKKKPIKKTKKQLKPFVPSETVPADQGVDFPYDI